MGAFKFITYDDVSDSDGEIAEIQMNKICSIKEMKRESMCSIKLLDDDSEYENPGSPNLKLEKTCSIQLVDPEEFDVMSSVCQKAQPNTFYQNPHAPYFED